MTCRVSQKRCCFLVYSNTELNVCTMHKSFRSHITKQLNSEQPKLTRLHKLTVVAFSSDAALEKTVILRVRRMSPSKNRDAASRSDGEWQVWAVQVAISQTSSENHRGPPPEYLIITLISRISIIPQYTRNVCTRGARRVYRGCTQGDSPKFRSRLLTPGRSTLPYSHPGKASRSPPSRPLARPGYPPAR